MISIYPYSLDIMIQSKAKISLSSSKREMNKYPYLKCFFYARPQDFWH